MKTFVEKWRDSKMKENTIEKHLVYHHNMFGPSCEIASLNNDEDFKIYSFSFNIYCMLKAYHEHKDNFELLTQLPEELQFFLLSTLYAIFRRCFHPANKNLFQFLNKHPKEQ